MPEFFAVFISSMFGLFLDLQGALMLRETQEEEKMAKMMQFVWFVLVIFLVIF